MTYSPPLVTATTNAIGVALGTELPEDRDALRDAVRVLCTDARRMGVRPEELVVLIKRTWRSHPEISSQPRVQTSPILDHIVTMCIEEYFRTTVPT